MIKPTTLLAAFELGPDFWFSTVIGGIDGPLLKVAKLKDELTWHARGSKDEMIFVVKGKLRIELATGFFELGEGEFATVPAGTQHNPVVDQECWILLIEPASTKHTSEEITPRTEPIADKIA